MAIEVEASRATLATIDPYGLGKALVSMPSHCSLNHKQWIDRFMPQKHSPGVLQPERLRRNMPVHRL